MSVERILENFGVKLKKDLQKSYMDKQKEKSAKYGRGFNENSNLYNSIKFEIHESEGSVVFELKMNNYWNVINKGRRPGRVSQAGQEAIKNWIRKVNIKPLTKPLNYEKWRTGLAFVIARKIAKKGFKGTNYYSNVIEDGRLDRLKIELQEEIKKDIIVTFNEN